jgi:hypothetical protein
MDAEHENFKNRDMKDPERGKGGNFCIEGSTGTDWEQVSA